MRNTVSDRFATLFTTVLKVAVTAILLCIAAITFVDVVGRYIFSAPIPGAFEIQEFGMGILIFSGLPLVTAHRGHITVSLVEGVFKSNRVLRRVQVAFFHLVSAGIVGLLTYCLLIQAQNAQRWGTSSAFLQMPNYPVMYFMAVMGAVTCLVLLTQSVFGAMGVGPDIEKGDGEGGWQL